MWAYGIDKEALKKVQRIPIENRRPSMGIKKMEVPKPSLGADEVLIQPKFTALNYNSIWSALGHPITPFQLISGHVSRNARDKDHLTDYAIFGSDCAGVVVETGSNVTKWTKGDEVVVHCNVVNPLDPIVENDSMKSSTQSIWGYETNFGAFAEFCKVKSNQLLAKPTQVDWPTSASYCLTLSTAYRMLISQNGAQIKAGETCLIWGAAGGLGTFAIQLCKMAGAKVIAVVSNQEKAEVCKSLGADLVIDRSEVNFGPFLLPNGRADKLAWAKGKKFLNSKGFGSIDVVFEHIGAATLGASIYFLRKGGRVVLCAASSGFDAEIDLRYLWMEVKSLIGSHFANYHEAEQSTSLIRDGKIIPVMQGIYDIKDLGVLMDQMYDGKTCGKIVFKH